MSAPSVGPWTLLAPLGRGGMGVVWRARHRGTDAPAAVKIIGRTPRTGRVQDALRNELEAAASLSHPAILAVFDHGVVTHEEAREAMLTADQPWLAMELATGGTLEDHLEDLTWVGVQDVLLTLLDALAHAHARGVVHRDLKPSNVLLAGPDDLRPGLKLTDFGIATIVDAVDNAQRVTGTPRYMAPEQFRGDLRVVGPWTDLYALGALAWELVTGRAPFEAADPSRLAVLHLYQPPPTFHPRMAVPPGLEAWLRRLLMKDPDERYRRAPDAAWALAAMPAAAGSAVSARLPAGTRPEPTLDRIEIAATTTSGSTLIDLVLPEGIEAAPIPLGPPPLAVLAPPMPEEWTRATNTPAPQLPGSLRLFGLRSVPLMGRREQRDALWRMLREVHDERQPRVAVLHGPPGIGKSAVARWLVERAAEVGAADGLVATHGRLPSPSHGLGPMLARHLRVQGLRWDQATEALHRALKRYEMRDPTEVTALAALLTAGDEADAGGWSGTAERHALLARTLGMLSRERPMIVWIDDATWAPEAVAWIQWILHHRTERLAVMFVLTVQDDLVEPDAPLADLLEHRDVRALPLRPMRLWTMQQLVQALAGLPPELAREVAGRVGGNPLLATHLLGDWIERELLSTTEQGVTLVRQPPAVAPGDLHALWSARIQRVLGETRDAGRRALEIAAALGDEVDQEEWEDACERAALPYHGLRSRLTRERLATPTPAGWRFVHGIVRDAIERDAREANRWPDANRVCATMLRERRDHPGRLGRVGHHLAEAGAWAEALDALLEAARRRMLKDEVHLAAQLVWDAAVAADALELPIEDGRRGVITLLQARILKSRHELAAAFAEAHEVELLAMEHGWPRLEAEALAEQGDIERVRGDLPRSLLLFRLALRRHEEADDHQGVADTLRSLSAVALQLGETQAADRLLTDALSRYHVLGDRFGVGMAQAGLGDIARVRGRWSEAIQHFRAALGQLRELGHRSGTAVGLHGLAEVYRLTGNLDAAEDGYREVIRLDTALGRDTSLSRLNLALCQIEREAFELAAPTLEELEGTWSEQGRPGYLAVVLVAWLPCLAADGRWRAFRERLDAAIPLLEACSLVEMDVARLAELAGSLAAESGREDEAQAAWSLALDQWESLRAGDAVLRVRSRMARLDEQPALDG